MFLERKSAKEKIQGHKGSQVMASWPEKYLIMIHLKYQGKKVNFHLTWHLRAAKFI